MLKIRKSAIRIHTAGTPPKIIEEFMESDAFDAPTLSLARIVSPSGWSESGETSEFDEYTIVLRGLLRVETLDGSQDVLEGQAVLIPHGQWVCYSTPSHEGAEYIAVCSPACSPQIANQGVA